MLKLVILLCTLEALAACKPAPDETMGGCGGEYVATTSAPEGGSGGGAGGSAPTCAEWEYPAGAPFAVECPGESERCEHATFGDKSVPVCCPPEEPCAPPVTGADRCDPMLGTFLGWCCLPDCD